MYLSVSLEKTDVTEMGLKSLHCVGLVIFGTGVIVAYFHCCGITLAEMDSLRRMARGAANAGAPNSRNQVGTASRPMAVGLSRSSI